MLTKKIFEHETIIMAIIGYFNKPTRLGLATELSE